MAEEMPRIIKPLPPDHPIFSIGPSFVLRERPPPDDDTNKKQPTGDGNRDDSPSETEDE